MFHLVMVLIAAVVNKSHFAHDQLQWSQQLLQLFPQENLSEMDCVLVICDVYSV